MEMRIDGADMHWVCTAHGDTPLRCRAIFLRRNVYLKRASGAGRPKKSASNQLLLYCAGCKKMEYYDIEMEMFGELPVKSSEKVVSSNDIVEGL